MMSTLLFNQTLKGLAAVVFTTLKGGGVKVSNVLLSIDAYGRPRVEISTESEVYTKDSQPILTEQLTALLGSDEYTFTYDKLHKNYKIWFTAGEVQAQWASQ